VLCGGSTTRGEYVRVLHGGRRDSTAISGTEFTFRLSSYLPADSTGKYLFRMESHEPRPAGGKYRDDDK